MVDTEEYKKNLIFKPVASPFENSVVYANFKISERGVSVISDGEAIDSEKAQRLAENASKALALAERINNGNKIEWLSDGLRINFPKEASKAKILLMNIRKQKRF